MSLMHFSAHCCPLVISPFTHDDLSVRTPGSKRNIKPSGGKYADAAIIRVPEELISLQNGVELPSIENLIGIIHEHRKTKDRVQAARFYLRLCGHGLEIQEDLGNHLVPMLVGCGNVYTAQRIFEKLAYHSEHTWTSMLQGYINSGESSLAVDAFNKMQAHDVHPTTHTFVALLKACESLLDIEGGREVHVGVVQRGYDIDEYVSNSLLCMYVKCGSVLDAQKVFDQLPVQDTISWTALMAGYVDCDRSEEALNCLEKILEEGVVPDAIMFACSLKACGNLGTPERGQKIHAEIVIEGLELVSFVGNTLVDMYAKCGLLEEAKELFDELPERDIVSWTALMAGFAVNGLGEEAVTCLEQMQSEGMIPDSVMYISGLKACCCMGCIHKGFELHGEIAQEGFQLEQTICNTLIDMYASFGFLVEAHAVLEELDSRDVVSWTALIAGYAEHGMREEVQSCLYQMRVEGCSPNIPTYICSLKACSQPEALKWGWEMHSKFVKEGFEADTVLGSALVDMYAKCGSFIEAQAVLNELPSHNVVPWSALISGYAEQGAFEVALNCLEQMEQVGLSPSSITFVSCLKACSNAGALESGYKIHSEIIKKGFESIIICGNALVDMYAKCGLLFASQSVFDKLPSHDVISWTALLAGYAEHGHVEKAIGGLEWMQLDGISPDIMLWNTAILCYAEQGETGKALLPYARMQEQCVLPNSVSFASVLQACCNTAALETGRRIHTQIQLVKKLEATEELLVTALIDMYGKCGSMVNALQVFDAMLSKNIVQWNALITGYARQGESELVFHTFDGMRENGVQPDEITFTIILFACSHAGLVGKGQMFYELMIKEYNITPNFKHYSCIIDLLGRVGKLNEAVVMVEKMPSQADFVAWNTVLGACQKLGDVELGEQAFKSSMVLGEQDPTSFVLMSNVYADLGT